MGLLDLFRKKQPPIIKELDAGTLGGLMWSVEEDAWAGSFQGVEFFVSPDDSNECPSQNLMAYAESVLSVKAWLLEAVTTEKEKYLTKHPEFRNELQDLQICALAFSNHKKKGLYLNCQLGFGAPNRFWSLDFHGRYCSAIGFDS